MLPGSRKFLATVAVASVLGLSPVARAEVNAGAAPDASRSAVPEQVANPELAAEDVGVDEKLGATASLDVTLRDEAGNPVVLRSLVDRPTILTLNYFRCGGICSPQLNGLAKALSRTNAVVGKEFRVLTVSFDERDNSEIAAKKQASYLREVKRPIQPADWRFLVGDAATTRKLADSVGFKFKQVNSDFVHAGAAILLSPTGKITRYLYGTTYLPADLEMAVREAAIGQVQPTINKWLKFCFTYDPEGRKYTLSTTRVAGTFVLGAAIAFAAVLRFKGKPAKSAASTRKA